MVPEDAARFQQEQIADCDLADQVPQAVRQPFDALRSRFAHGVFDYGVYSQVSTGAVLMLEGVLRERFALWCGGEVTFEDVTGSRDPRALPVTSPHDVPDLPKQLPTGRGATRSRWKLRVGGELIEFNGMLKGLMGWARAAGLLRGQRARGYEKGLVPYRNEIAHAGGHLVFTPVEAAKAVRDLAEFTNQLWGRPTPGGRRYPAPVRREVAVISWDDTGRTSLAAGETLREDDGRDGWSHVLVRTASLPGQRPEDPHWMDFDARFETTQYPTEYLWGPGTRGHALAWLDREQPEGDTADHVDRVFIVRTHEDRVLPPMRPEVAAGLTGAETMGVWHAMHADFPLDAFNHVRGLQEPTTGHETGQGDCACPVRVLAAGTHEEALAGAEATLGPIAPVRPPLSFSRSCNGAAGLRARHDCVPLSKA
ncbi:hypothetical protein ACIBCM_23155 [Streptomyces sp. NPDC051018]|uniref:hypothetical protein n=1 Tax=Streptomyces sp. NPDC051018 TaxID=3365639 RepID=UPI00378866D1